MTAPLLLLALLLVQEPQAGPGRWAEHPEADALRYDIRVAVDPVQRRVEGQVDYLFQALEPLEWLRLDSLAGEGWEVSFTTAEGAPMEAVRHGDELWLRLPRAAGPGEEIRFSARVAGLPPSGLYFRSTRHGDPCALTDHFPALARGWLPCEDAPGDRAAFRLRVEVPAGFQAVGTGRGAWEAGETRAWIAESERELPTYLLAFAVAAFAEVVEEGDPRLVPHRVYPQDRAAARRALKHHGAWMRTMEETFGPYPYAKYCVVQVPTRWGAMEYPGNTFVAEGLFDGRRGGASTLAHEFAHQWFGDGVGYADWSEVWLSEGFASYFGPWLDAQTGGPALEQAMERARRSWLASAEGRRLPVIWAAYDDPDQVINSNAYPKGAWILHMLRQEVGDEAFFAGIRDFYRSNLNCAVSTPSLRAAMERAAGRELGWFFEQWLERPGCPELKLAWESGRVTVEQVQDGEPYRFPLTLQWTGADRAVHRKTVRVAARSATVELEPPLYGGPLVDPDVQLLYRRVR